MAAARTANPSPVHLVVIIHGLWGSPEHVGHLASTLEKISGRTTNSTPLSILIPRSIQWTNTYDGIDYCAEHVAQEIDLRRAELELDGKVLTKFSCIGYSLGGLIARFLVGLLHSRQPSFFEEVEPMNFNTFASPWIGMPKYKGILSSTIHFFGSRLLSRTGNQLYLTDKYHQLPASSSANPTDKPSKKKFPLLSFLAHPETNFYKALVNFKVVRIYANAINDRTVPFVTGAMEKFDLFQIAHQISKKSKIMSQSSSDLTESEVLELGGLELTLNPDCPSLIEKVQLVKLGPQSEKRKRAEPMEGTKKTNQEKPKRSLPKLPFFLKPSTYPYRAPLNYLAAGLSPVIAPIFLTYILCSFCYQSIQSRQRIKKYNVGELENHFSRLRRVGLLQELRQDLIEDLAGIGNEPSLEADPADEQTTLPSTNRAGLSTHPNSAETQQLIHLETPTSALHPPDQPNSVDQPSKSHPTQGTQYLTSLSSDAIKSITNDLGLSPLQIDMLDRLNQLPNLAKYFSFLDGIPNSHGAIIYRVDGLSDRRGKRIVSHWAERFVL
ncbi:hypothetical protein PGT21_008413 [Puccinia graminis f. sp. tritici]|uniref:DUF676 domain-containing protein n=1 Tax=Puccinia graminis f. sp. tritici TaxID=56615 RepID=A0A5B0NFF4_PUCGR|nr:hypothetical protein PGT21_008413 [Puccinia graminis f. sp. tritici]